MLSITDKQLMDFVAKESASPNSSPASSSGLLAGSAGEPYSFDPDKAVVSRLGFLLAIYRKSSETRIRFSSSATPTRWFP